MAKRAVKSTKRSSKKVAAKALARSRSKAATTKAPARRAKTPAPTAGRDGKHDASPGLEGWITHTEFATRDPGATKAFVQKVFGWSFGEPFMLGPGNPYHLFGYAKTGGGGIMGLRPGEAPRVTPYVHVANVAKTMEKALKAGAKHIMGPDAVMPGVTLGVVEAPGGVMLGFSGPK